MFQNWVKIRNGLRKNQNCSYFIKKCVDHGQSVQYPRTLESSNNFLRTAFLESELQL